MATSVLMGSLEDPPRPESGGTPVQRGRKKKGSEQSQRTKKNPQRGMGVAQLERLRQKEMITESTQLHRRLLNQYYVPSPIYPGFTGYGLVGQMGFNQRALGLLGSVGGPVVGGGYSELSTGGGFGFGLPSIPNYNQFSNHWGFSNKKKRLSDEMKGFGEIVSQINGSDFLGINLEIKKEEIRVKSPSLASYLGGNTDQEGELVAVHRKGGDQSSILMEYQFFPGYKNDYKYSNQSTHPKKEEEEEDCGGGDSPSLSLSTTTTTATTLLHSKTTTNIDLSLKL